MSGGRKYQLTTNVFQATILCLFNDKDELTCQEIKQETQIEDQRFKEAMLVFCNPKMGLLEKEQKKKVSFPDNEKIRPNPLFKHALLKLNLIPRRVKNIATEID